MRCMLLKVVFMCFAVDYLNASSLLRPRAGFVLAGAVVLTGSCLMLLVSVTSRRTAHLKQHSRKRNRKQTRSHRQHHPAGAMTSHMTSHDASSSTAPLSSSSDDDASWFNYDTTAPLESPEWNELRSVTPSVDSVSSDSTPRSHSEHGQHSQNAMRGSHTAEYSRRADDTPSQYFLPYTEAQQIQRLNHASNRQICHCGETSRVKPDVNVVRPRAIHAVADKASAFTPVVKQHASSVVKKTNSGIWQKLELQQQNSCNSMMMTSQPKGLNSCQPICNHALTSVPDVALMTNNPHAEANKSTQV